MRPSFVALPVAMGSFTATAWAADAAPAAAESLLELAKPLVAAITAGQYWYAAALALVLAVAALRKYGAPRFAWMSRPWAAPAMTLVASFGGALATTLAAGTAPSWAMAWAALGIGVAAAGGWKLLKELVVDPLVRPLVAKAPAWLRPVLELALWVFDRPDAGAAARKAGDAAVEANPGKGAAAVVGAPTDVA